MTAEELKKWCACPSCNDLLNIEVQYATRGKKRIIATCEASNCSFHTITFIVRKGDASIDTWNKVAVALRKVLPVYK